MRRGYPVHRATPDAADSTPLEQPPDVLRVPLWQLGENKDSNHNRRRNV